MYLDMLLVVSGEQMGDMSPSLISGHFPEIAPQINVSLKAVQDIFPAGQVYIWIIRDVVSRIKQACSNSSYSTE